MLVLRSLNAVKRISFISRSISTKECLAQLTMDTDGIAVISLKRPPVNSLSLEFLQEISSNLDVLQDDECKGIVITSGLSKLFSSGVDLKELHNPDPERLRKFWSTYQDLFLKLYGSGHISAVAINGYAGAGACILSLLCDYRVMVKDGKSKIGLNDTAVGIVPRPWVCAIMERAMGYWQAEKALTASTMYNAEEALKVNLIDETALDNEDAIVKCKQFIRRYDNISLKVRANTKRHLRAATIGLVEGNKEEDIKSLMESVLDPKTQKPISKFVQQLKQK